jgi:hypothetical protein
MQLNDVALFFNSEGAFKKSEKAQVKEKLAL